jgi:proteasome lid subunit RPN8/RPN11
MDTSRVITLPLAVWQAMRDQVDRWSPEEACGLLAGQLPGQVERSFPITNRLHSPSRFEMEPREQLRAFQDIEAAGLALLAIYHSHPMGPSNPSPTDLAEYAYPGVAYLIWAPELSGTSPIWNARGYWLENDGYNEIPLQVMQPL